MKKKDKVILYLFYGIMIMFIVSMIIFGIWALVTYGDKPITEVPSWYFWLINGKG